MTCNPPGQHIPPMLPGPVRVDSNFPASCCTPDWLARRHSPCELGSRYAAKITSAAFTCMRMHFRELKDWETRNCDRLMLAFISSWCGVASSTSGGETRPKRQAYCQLPPLRRPITHWAQHQKPHLSDGFSTRWRGYAACILMLHQGPGQSCERLDQGEFALVRQPRRSIATLIAGHEMRNCSSFSRKRTAINSLFLSISSEILIGAAVCNGDISRCSILGRLAFLPNENLQPC